MNEQEEREESVAVAEAKKKLIIWKNKNENKNILWNCCSSVQSIFIHLCVFVYWAHVCSQAIASVSLSSHSIHHISSE